jgi:hypothetical protein
MDREARTAARDGRDVLRPPSRAIAALCALLLGGAACSDGAQGGTVDAAGPDRAGIDLSLPVYDFAGREPVMCNPPGPVCNDVVNDAPTIYEMYVAADEPTPLGGTIADGRYWLTATVVYSGPGGATGPTGNIEQHTTVISNGVITGRGSRNGCPDETTLLDFTTSGNRLMAVEACPTAQTLEYQGFDAGPDTLIVYLSPTRSEVFSRR